MPESSPAIAAPSTVSKPDPDPTILTTQALYREVNQLSLLIDSQMDGLYGKIDARVTAMDNALGRIRQLVDREPEATAQLIDHLRSIHEEKFKSIQVQFTERDVRTEQTSRDSKVAVDAALQAAKEAVGEQNKSSALAIAKSEASTTKQIDQQGLLIASSTKGLDDKIDDIKERLTRIEGAGTGSKATRDDSRSIIAVLISAVAVIVVIINAVVSLVAKH